MPLKDTIRQEARDEIRGVSVLAKAAAKSGTYLYPLKGLVYFAGHRELWTPLTSRFLPLLVLSVGVVVPMFLFTYIPQSFVLQLINGPLAWITTVVLVLSESATIITALASMFLVDETLVDTFDLVLLSRGLPSLVQSGREPRGAGRGTGTGRLGKLLRMPFSRFTPRALARYVVCLPLNFIPLLGTTLFLLVQGRQQGPAYHARYFQLKRLSAAQRDAFVKRNIPSYLAFGVAAVLLQLVPGASILFLYSNTVGAALWASELERRGLAPPVGEDQSGAELPERGETGESERAVKEEL